MGDSLPSDAQRLLLGVQAIHSRLVRELDRAAAAASRAPSGPSGRRPRHRGGGEDTDALEVPEFIPPG